MLTDTANVIYPSVMCDRIEEGKST